MSDSFTFSLSSAAACDSDPVVRVDDANSSSVVLTPISEVSSADLSVSSPHFQNPDGLLEPTGAPSETAAQQDNPTGDTPAEKDPKKTKQHLHCPICKVTVNSTNQMDAHNSGAYLSFFIRLFIHTTIQRFAFSKNFVKEINQKCQ